MSTVYFIPWEEVTSLIGSLRLPNFLIISWEDMPQEASLKMCVHTYRDRWEEKLFLRCFSRVCACMCVDISIRLIELIRGRWNGPTSKWKS